MDGGRGGGLSRQGALKILCRGPLNHANERGKTANDQIN